MEISVSNDEAQTRSDTKEASVDIAVLVAHTDRGWMAEIYDMHIGGPLLGPYERREEIEPAIAGAVGAICGVAATDVNLRIRETPADAAAAYAEILGS